MVISMNIDLLIRHPHTLQGLFTGTCVSQCHAKASHHASALHSSESALPAGYVVSCNAALSVGRACQGDQAVLSRHPISDFYCIACKCDVRVAGTVACAWMSDSCLAEKLNGGLSCGLVC
eukprot:GHUV01044831.1.p1 GENE.GHUV01044831.1~~GHUV01044831.1.p1  ORF type:complete len:120 (-),score=7.12 GHUV01044831.1:138-497(-)